MSQVITKLSIFIYTEGICGFKSLRKKPSYLIFFFYRRWRRKILKYYCWKVDRESTTEELSPACLISSISLPLSEKQWKLCLILSTCFAASKPRLWLAALGSVGLHWHKEGNLAIEVFVQIHSLSTENITSDLLGNPTSLAVGKTESPSNEWAT